ncbi:MAG: amidase [Rhodobacteraceae bacterium]|nr:amidase [Paracoccaceae bacterium]
MTDIPSLSALELARLVQARKVTATDILRDYRAQVEARNSEINAFVTLDWDAAHTRAETLDAMGARGEFAGPLHGVPVAIKDTFETKGLRTTWGSRSFETHVPDFDALHVARLREAGAVIFGKTNAPEFAFSGQTSNLVAGTTRNPHDPSRTVAGSSGGAAAALAANMTALADGSDLGGSVRTPAAWCGVVGFRPTSGLVPYHPNPAPFDGLYVPGPMARNVTDTVLMLRVMAGASPLQPLGFSGEIPDLNTLDHVFPAGRIAFAALPFGTRTDPSILAALTPVQDLCRDLGWHVEDAAPPLDALHDYAQLTRGLSALGVRRTLNPDMSLAAPSFHTACAGADGLSLADFVDYQAVRADVWDKTARFFETYEFALWPTSSGRAFSADLQDHEITEDWRNVTLSPVMELPSISIPFGTDQDGLPVGLHISGPKGSDARLLRFARQIENALT